MLYDRNLKKTKNKNNKDKQKNNRYLRENMTPSKQYKKENGSKNNPKSSHVECPLH